MNMKIHIVTTNKTNYKNRTVIKTILLTKTSNKSFIMYNTLKQINFKVHNYGECSIHF